MTIFLHKRMLVSDLTAVTYGDEHFFFSLSNDTSSSMVFLLVLIQLFDILTQLILLEIHFIVIGLNFSIYLIRIYLLNSLQVDHSKSRVQRFDMLVSNISAFIFTFTFSHVQNSLFYSIELYSIYTQTCTSEANFPLSIKY